MPTPGWRGLCNATRRIRTNGAKLEQGLGKGHGCEAMKAPVGLSSGSAVCNSRWRGFAPTSACPNKDDCVDSNFSSIENLWPQVDTCFRPFRATLKISEVEPQCTLKILQSKTCEKAKPLLMVTVHTERSSCPCFAAALSGSPTESVRSWRSISFRRLMKNSRCSFPKEKYRPARQAKNFVG